MSTISRRDATTRKHTLLVLFSRTLQSQPSGRNDARGGADRAGMHRTVGAENRIRGKKPLLIEHISEKVDVAAKATDDDCNAMHNRRCRDLALLLFMSVRLCVGAKLTYCCGRT